MTKSLTTYLVRYEYQEDTKLCTNAADYVMAWVLSWGQQPAQVHWMGKLFAYLQNREGFCISIRPHLVWPCLPL